MLEIVVFSCLKQPAGAGYFFGIFIIVMDPQVNVEDLEPVRVFFIPLGLSGLSLQTCHLAIDFRYDVAHPQEILVR